VKTYEGLLDRVVFPPRLTAHVVLPAADPRIHGYAVEADLARNVGFVDVGWLALTGELPDAAEREALTTALILLAPLHVGEAPTHAGVLARVAGAPDEVVPAIAVVALGQRIAAEVQALAPLFQWLREPMGPPPAAAVLADPTADQRERQHIVATASARWFGPERALPDGPVLTREATAYALLHRLGVGDPMRLQAFATWARLPVILAEAACTTPGAVHDYPGDLPPYRYVEES
jgi:hypothetical protein